MKYAVLTSLLVLSVSAQLPFDEFTCNHYQYYTVDVCYQVDVNTQELYECNSDNSITLFNFTDGSCGTQNPTPSSAITFDASAGASIGFKCDQSTACGYFTVYYYQDENCLGDSSLATAESATAITGQCYSTSTSSSEMYTCSGNEETFEIYDNSDCSGSASSSGTINYEERTDSEVGCYEV